ncbi:hypothetical protein ATKI12_1695 [Kitasatospora sp. Ki12]
MGGFTPRRRPPRRPPRPPAVPARRPPLDRRIPLNERTVIMC